MSKMCKMRNGRGVTNVPLLHSEWYCTCADADLKQDILKTVTIITENCHSSNVVMFPAASQKGNVSKVKKSNFCTSRRVQSTKSIHKHQHQLAQFDCSKPAAIHSSSKWNDLISDCGPEANDEQILKNVLLKNIEISCKDPGLFPCLEGHPKCYNISDLCSYQLDTFGHMSFCRNGAHVKNLQKV